MTQLRERNERLAEAMARAALTSGDLAAKAEVDPRTIDRLVADRTRTPRAHSRHAIAEAVQVPVGILWPFASNGAQATNELSALYPSRAAMPIGLVMSLLSAAERDIDVLMYAGIWLWDSVAGFGTALAAKARAGVNVRVCLGDPASDAVRVRGVEEGIDELLAARCRLAATYASHALAETPGALRLHGTTLYASVLRFDDELLVNWHLYGAPAAEAPMLQLSRASNHGLATRVANSFERVWSSAQAIAG